MQNIFIFTLAGLIILAGGFAFGYFYAYRKYIKQYSQLDVEDSYIMAGLLLSIIEAIKTQKHENAIQILSGRVVIALHNWVANKNKLSEKRINYLESSSPGQYVQKYGTSYIDQAKVLSKNF
jgi:hypothetical protein